MYSLGLAVLLLVTSTDLQTYSVEYNGDIYEYVSDFPDNENACIVTKTGETIYIKDIL